MFLYAFTFGNNLDKFDVGRLLIDIIVDRTLDCPMRSSGPVPRHAEIDKYFSDFLFLLNSLIYPML